MIVLSINISLVNVIEPLERTKKKKEKCVFSLTKGTLNI